jgi:hypothetical protein
MSLFCFYILFCTYCTVLCSILPLQEFSCVSPDAAADAAVAAAADAIVADADSSAAAADADVVVADAADSSAVVAACDADVVVAAAADSSAAAAADVVAAAAIVAAAAAIAAGDDAAGVKFLSHSHTGPVVASHTGDTGYRGQAFMYSLINISYC